MKMKMKMVMVILAAGLASVSVPAADDKFHLDGRRETFTNTSGRVFTDVHLFHADKLGLTWGTTTNAATGMVRWTALPDDEIERMRLPAYFKAMDLAKARSASEAQARARAAAADAARTAADRSASAKVEDELTKIFPKFNWRGPQVTASVGPGFMLFTFEEKKTATMLLLAYVRTKEPSAQFVDLIDIYSGRQVGKLGVFGFSMK